jgi:hypothetical protein
MIGFLVSRQVGGKRRSPPEKHVSWPSFTCYELGSPTEFIEEVNALLGTGVRKTLTLKGRAKKSA